MALSVNLLETVRRDLVANENDSARLELTFKQGGAVVDMSGYTASAAEVLNADNGEVLESWNIDYTDAATGKLVLTLTTTQVANIRKCRCIWYLQVVLASDPANNSHTVIGGNFTVKRAEALGG